MRTLRLTLAAVVVITAMVAVAPRADASGGRVAFIRDGDLWIAEADGSNQVRVTSTPAAERHPSWAPDGSRIAFVRDSDLWSVRDDGGDEQLHVVDAGAPAWHPDGSSIVFAVAGDLRLLDVGTGAVRTLIDGVERSLDPPQPGYSVAGIPAWFPDGEFLAVRIHHTPLPPIAPYDQLHVVAVPPEGEPQGSEVNWTEHHWDEGPGAAWSADGRRFAFSQIRRVCRSYGGGYGGGGWVECEDHHRVRVVDGTLAHGETWLPFTAGTLGGSGVRVAWLPDGCLLYETGDGSDYGSYSTIARACPSGVPDAPWTVGTLIADAAQPAVEPAGAVARDPAIVDRMVVPATSETIVGSHPMEPGQSYRVRSRGTYAFYNRADVQRTLTDPVYFAVRDIVDVPVPDLLADAECRGAPHGDDVWIDSDEQGDLALNGGPPAWQPVDPTPSGCSRVHEYTHTFTLPALYAGVNVEARVEDADDHNRGVILVTLERVED